MIYHARFEPDGEGWLVTFPAIPEAVTGGPDRARAFENATDALEVALLTYAKDGRDLPDEEAAAARLPRSGLAPVPVSASVAAKLAFIQAFRESGLTRVALAERLGKGETEVRRMLDPYYGSKLSSLEEAMKALGKRFVLSVEEAA